MEMIQACCQYLINSQQDIICNDIHVHATMKLALEHSQITSVGAITH